ncbi:MAG: glucan biosynthesis protein [Geminicoccaceae bacterium]|nr:glucan biosynthesis protein [Geminicoccaceae bacterium]
MVNRRRALLRLAAGFAGLAAVPRGAASAPRLGEPEAHSFELLVERARTLARAPFLPPPRPAAELVEAIDYERHGQIRYRPERAVWAEGPGRHPVTFFPLGRFFPHPVTIHLVEGGRARRVLFDPEDYDSPADSPWRRIGAAGGHAGLRIHEPRSRADWPRQDWLAFLGASYFRAIGELGQYGLSARGVAVDTAEPSGEEFPGFTSFWIHPAIGVEDPVVIEALLDGPSLAGAFRFLAWRGAGVEMEVDALLFFRRQVARLGIAPLTSMFWYGEHGESRWLDWRPEVHDSDGLAIWTGAGERIWRPLNNPETVVVSSFLDRDPRGFGLLQRDREVEHYLDGVRFERRPSAWVEPLHGWGAGAVQLVEIPTDHEIHDNIVAMWVPRDPPREGGEGRWRYRLFWLAEDPYAPRGLATVAATRVGRGHEPGKPRALDIFRIVVEFEGRALDALPAGTVPEPVVSASRGRLLAVLAEPVPGTRRLRILFDLHAPGREPVELRAWLRLADRALSETWLWQLRPGVTG